MKKFYLILAMCIVTSVFAQNSFPTSNAIWNESVEGRSRYYGLLGDTIINEKLYSKLYQFSDTVLLYDKIKGYVGALRNEVQKVFFKPGYTPYPEILLYDFGAKVGDTVWHNAKMVYDEYYHDYYIEYCSDNDCYSVIYEITDDRTYYTYSPIPMWDIGVWKEGIGSDNGLLLSIGVSFPMCMSFNDFNLNCFKHNDTVKYLWNPKCNQCFCPTVNMKEHLDYDFINVFPNPNIGNFRIKCSNFRIDDIEIFDIIGTKLEAKSMMQIAEDEIIIDISHLQSGMYFLKIENLIFKIIKN